MSRFLLPLLWAMLPGVALALGSPPIYETQNHAFLWTQGAMSDIGTLGGKSATAYAINAGGQVVGTSTLANGEGHAFLWSSGTMHDLGTLGGNYSVAYGINDAGQVVGLASTPDGSEHAFLWSQGVMSDLGTLNGNHNSEARAINNLGQVVGVSRPDNGTTPRAFLWQAGTMTGIGNANGSYSWASDINDAGVVTGVADFTCCGWYTAVTWSGGGGATPLAGIPSTVYSFGNAINASGQVAGSYFQPQAGDSNHAFVWTAGQLTPLSGGYPYGGYIAVDINDSGQVVGNSDLTRDAFIWNQGVATNLGSLSNGVTRAYGINAGGQVVGSSEVFIPIVPEPASALLLGAGLLVLFRSRALRRPGRARRPACRAARRSRRARRAAACLRT